MNASTRVKLMLEVEKETPLPQLFEDLCELVEKNRKTVLKIMHGGLKEIEDYKKVRQEIIDFFKNYGEIK
jgi:hypothetical protein